MLQSKCLDKVNVTKNTFFFHSRALTRHRFSFDFESLYTLKQTFHLSKNVCGIFHFRFRLVFIKVYICVQQKAWTF